MANYIHSAHFKCIFNCFSGKFSQIQLILRVTHCSHVALIKTSVLLEHYQFIRLLSTCAKKILFQKFLLVRCLQSGVFLSVACPLP